MEENLINDYSNGDKPKVVFFGINFLFIALIFEAVYIWLQGTTVLSFLLVLLIIGYIVFLVNDGKKWARSLILFITILKTITLPFVIWNFIKSDSWNTIKIILLSILIFKYLLELCAIIMLYSKSANVWFNPEKKALI
jgi:hypothetical protein